jgi:hypothetical protein
MTALGLRPTHIRRSNEFVWQGLARCTGTATGSDVEAPAPSAAAASTGEPGSPNVPRKLPLDHAFEWARRVHVLAVEEFIGEPHIDAWYKAATTDRDKMQPAEEPPPSGAASTEEDDSTTAKWFQPVLNRLNHLLKLRDGWDGPGTVSVDLGAVGRTLSALDMIATRNTRPPSIAPGPDGSLQLAWYVRDFDLEIDIPRCGDPTAWLYERSSDEDLELSLASPRLRAVVARLAA